MSTEGVVATPSFRRGCSTPGCPNIGDGGRCVDCQARTDAGTLGPRQRGYDTAWDLVRARFLARHPICQRCDSLATVADHWPVSRRDLVAMGVRNPDAWARLRPLCDPCHKKETARLQPGGWARRW